ncbi:protein Hikeshi-like [Mytilus edulis]|uniref:HIKESHI n=1 Tax=Mytilus edulis TaxID=6550 RepID=A0A8S3Q1W2_MYTED|nr:HIKESHI [Mytilus edulis]
MFGLLIPGRLVQSEVQQINETHFVFNVEDADSINHIAIFLTGQTPFPDGYGGAVYFSFPNPTGQQWILLGVIANQKPSAIFKVTNLKSATDSTNPFGQCIPHMSHMAQIGISIETLEELSQQTPSPQAAVSTAETFVEYSRKMLENFFNFATSFTQTQAQMSPNPTETYVPLSTVQTWYQNFERRLQQNTFFWRS